MVKEAPAPTGAAMGAPTGGKVPFKIKRHVTRSVLKFVAEVSVHVKILTAMHMGKELKGRGEAATMEPATLCEVVNLDTGEEQQMLVSAVIKSIFTEEYPDDSYVGRGFLIIKHAKAEGKNYFTYSIDELDLE